MGIGCLTCNLYKKLTGRRIVGGHLLCPQRKLEKACGQKRMQMEEETREEKKMKKKNIGDGGYDHNEVLHTISNAVTTSANSSNLNADITTEILSRLPVKALMRFKCVCKYWFFLIQKDMAFIDLHLERSKARPHLLISNHNELCLTLPRKEEDYHKYTFMTADLSSGGRGGGAVTTAGFNTIQELDLTYYDIVFKPVNGLMGFFAETRIDPGVCIFNPSTREITPWIKSKLLGDIRKKAKEVSSNLNGLPLATCTLGYDPATKVYKVVGVWTSIRPVYTVCEVLTVGDNEWRQLNEVPRYTLQLQGSHVHVNGWIYYSTNMLTMSKANEKGMAKFIVAFDVGIEKFSTVMVPSYIFDQPEYNASYIFYNVRLLELDGRLGLFIALEGSGTTKLWLYGGDANNRNSTSSWTQVVTLELPYTLYRNWQNLSLNPISGTNQIILSSYRKPSDGKMFETTYHSYNWKNKSINEIEISGIPYSVPILTSESRVDIFSENLLPVWK